MVYKIRTEHYFPGGRRGEGGGGRGGGRGYEKFSCLHLCKHFFEQHLPANNFFSDIF